MTAVNFLSSSLTTRFQSSSKAAFDIQLYGAVPPVDDGADEAPEGGEPADALLESIRGVAVKTRSALGNGKRTSQARRRRHLAFSLRLAHSAALSLKYSWTVFTSASGTSSMPRSVIL